MNLLILILIAGLYFPMFGRILPVTSSLPYNFTNYSIVLFAITAFISLFNNNKNHKSNGKIFLLFGICFVLLLWFKGIVSGLLQEMNAKAMGVVLGTILLFILNRNVQENEKEEFFQKLSFFLGIMLILQFVISFYESRLGYTLGAYELKVYSYTGFTNDYALIGSRDPLILIGYTLDGLLGIKFAFTGLLGQHNAFGIMLVFYNLLFLAMYIKTRSKKWVFFLVIVVFSAIGNTTRTALFLIFITDLIIFYIIFLKNRFARSLLIFVVIILSVIYGTMLVTEIVAYFSASNTFISRINIWDIVLKSYPDNYQLVYIIFGLNPESLVTGAGLFAGGFLPSLENQFLSLFQFSGLAGLLLYIYSFLIVPIKSKKFFSPNSGLILKLLVLSILVISVTMDNVLYFANYFMIILLIYYCNLSHPAEYDDRLDDISKSTHVV